MIPPYPQLFQNYTFPTLIYRQNNDQNGKLARMQYYGLIYRPYSDFTFYPNNVLHNKWKSQLMC